MQVAGVTRPPEPFTLVMTAEPSSDTSAMGKPSRAKIGHVLEARVGEIPARHLAGALQEMAHNGALPQAIPVVRAPAEFERSAAPETGRDRQHGP